jgi:tetratricopeptide (TPR) repeat protein
MLYGINTQTPESLAASMQQHYDAAEHFQNDNNFRQAALQYQLFLSDAMQIIANNRTHIGKYEQAISLYDAALKFTPNDSALLLNYAEAALTANDFAKAKDLAIETINLYPKDSKSPDVATAHSVLGRDLWAMGNRKEGMQQLENAVAIDPTFTNGHNLATAYLALSDKNSAAKLFAEMLNGFGDTPELHLNFGKCYAAADDPDEAIREFKKAIEENSRLPGVHYALGATYLLKGGNIYFTQAKAELHKELAINPKDSLSYYLLGDIALQQHKLPEAIYNLSRSTRLDQQNPDAFLMLGKVYFDTGNTSKAETALRQAINATTDPSRNHYEIKSAYYELGHILIQKGQADEGKSDIRIAEKFLLHNKILDKDNLTGTTFVQPNTSKNIAAKLVDEKAEKDIVEYERRLGLAIADGYNNLGVIAAMNKDYSAAIGYFKQASAWNPTMDGLDDNLGRAAFKAHQYVQAVNPLSKALQMHLDDDNLRIMLGMSQYFTHNFSQVLQTLHPIEEQIKSVPLLEYMYAESMVQDGDYDDGIVRLKALSQSNPKNKILYYALGRAYASGGNHQEAVEEFRSALRLDPSDANTVYELALSLIKLRQMAEAQTLLSGLANAGSKNADVYYELGHLQLENKEIQIAVLNLEAAEKIDPGNVDVHRELADAYRQELKVDDAAREEKMLQAMSSKSIITKNISKPN